MKTQHLIFLRARSALMGEVKIIMFESLICKLQFLIKNEKYFTATKNVNNMLSKILSRWVFFRPYVLFLLLKFVCFLLLVLSIFLFLVILLMNLVTCVHSKKTRLVSYFFLFTDRVIYSLPL